MPSIGQSFFKLQYVAYCRPQKELPNKRIQACIPKRPYYNFVKYQCVPASLLQTSENNTLKWKWKPATEHLMKQFSIEISSSLPHPYLNNRLRDSINLRVTKAWWFLSYFAGQTDTVEYYQILMNSSVSSSITLTTNCN